MRQEVQQDLGLRVPVGATNTFPPRWTQDLNVWFTFRALSPVLILLLQTSQTGEGRTGSPSRPTPSYPGMTRTETGRRPSGPRHLCVYRSPKQYRQKDPRFWIFEFSFLYPSVILHTFRNPLGSVVDIIEIECLFSFFMVFIVSSLSKYWNDVNRLCQVWTDSSSGSVFTYLI